MLRSDDELIQGLGVAAPIRSKHRIYRKALIAFVVSKHAILEELIGQFGPVLCFQRLTELIVDDPNPRADAGQSPHIKLYIGSGKSFQNPDVQPGRWTTTAERNGFSAGWYRRRMVLAIGFSPKFAVLRLLAVLRSDY